MATLLKVSGALAAEIAHGRVATLVSLSGAEAVEDATTGRRSRPDASPACSNVYGSWSRSSLSSPRRRSTSQLSMSSAFGRPGCTPVRALAEPLRSDRHSGPTSNESRRASTARCRLSSSRFEPAATTNREG
jgi:hypothetical protein